MLDKLIGIRKPRRIWEEAAYQINKSLKNSQLMITEGLGHRKILGDKIVIENSIKFLKE